jgi:hypothetical protein
MTDRDVVVLIVDLIAFVALVVLFVVTHFVVWIVLGVAWGMLCVAQASVVRRSR